MKSIGSTEVIDCTIIIGYCVVIVKSIGSTEAIAFPMSIGSWVLIVKSIGSIDNIKSVINVGSWTLKVKSIGSTLNKKFHIKIGSWIFNVKSKTLRRKISLQHSTIDTVRILNAKSIVSPLTSTTTVKLIVRTYTVNVKNKTFILYIHTILSIISIT